VAARRLRAQMSLPEVLLWNAIRGRRLGGLLFRRQHPIGDYVLDFYCPAVRLAVEVDGRVHELPDRMRRDAVRDAFLAERGIRVLRLPAKMVLEDLDAAWRAIEAAAQA
jgi:very-short-patch-repair endonuclease